MIEENAPPGWTYRLEDGFCRNSMAFATARAFGVPAEIIDRAFQIQQEYDLKLQTLGLPGGRGCIFTERNAECREDSREYSVDTLTGLLRTIAEKSGDLLLSSMVHVIGHGHHPPPVTEGKSAVYLLLKTKRGACSRETSSKDEVTCLSCNCSVGWLFFQWYLI